MAITEQTRTQLIGLSVAMLGQAPGTARLNDWARMVGEDGMSVDDLANHIAESDAFVARYPIFQTSEDFAEEFLGVALHGVSEDTMEEAVTLVASMLNDGMGRGSLVLAVVNFLHDVAMKGMDHDAYGEFGMPAMAMANKVEVASHYTITARMADPNAEVLASVTADADTVAAATNAIDNPPVPPEEIPTGQTFSLGTLRDKVVGTEYDDVILSEPDSKGDETLGPADTIDGGAGNDSFEIYDISLNGLIIDSNVDADVVNVEDAYLSARHGIDVDLTKWEGLESVELGRFGTDAVVKVSVDGASVSTTRTFGGSEVSIVGASGALDMIASKATAVKVGSGAHTTSVMVKGGSAVDVSGNGKVGGAASQSMTVTSVTIDGVKGEGLGADGKRGNPMEPVPNPLYDADASDGVRTYMYLTSAGQTADVPTVTDGDGAHVTNDQNSAAQRNQVFKDGKRVDPGTEGAMDGEDSGGVPVHIYSDSIESVALHNTYATAAVVNKSKEAEDLMVTVNKYGTATIAGKLCLGGDGAAENVSIMVAGNSNFALANNKTKAVDINLGADLTLEVTNFVSPPTNVDAGGANSPAASTTLESLMLGGGGKFTMNAMGLTKLKTIDASGASGDVVINNVGGSVTSYMGGSGFDCIGVASHGTGGIMVELGAGDDAFKSGAGSAKSRVDGGDGMDELHLTSAAVGTYKDAGKDKSIYTNFELLNIANSLAGTYDVEMLGVESVIVKSKMSTSTEAVTLKNMSDGMGISVHGMGAEGTSANITHQMKERGPGDPRYSGELDLHLQANGGAKDTKAMQTGKASLTLTLTNEDDIEVLDVNSSANAGGSGTNPATNRPSAGNYMNTLTVAGAGSTVEAIDVTGNAKLTIMADDGVLSNLELIDAVANSGGVTFDASADGAVLGQKLEMRGSSAKDVFNGGSGDDKLTGNGGIDTLTGNGGSDMLRGGAGGDMLDGGDGADHYIIASVSDSQLSFNAKTGAVEGVDIISEESSWSTADKILIAKSVYESFQGVIKNSDTGQVTPDAWVIDNTDDKDVDHDENPDTPSIDDSPNSLSAFVKANANGFFETTTPTTGNGFGGTVNHHSVAVVQSTIDPDGADGEAGEVSMTWVFIDADGDGDFNAANDMVIGFTGLVTIEEANFGAMS